jgi:hypothetical protein
MLIAIHTKQKQYAAEEDSSDEYCDFWFDPHQGFDIWTGVETVTIKAGPGQRNGHLYYGKSAKAFRDALVYQIGAILDPPTKPAKFGDHGTVILNPLDSIEYRPNPVRTIDMRSWEP